MTKRARDLSHSEFDLDFILLYIRHCALILLVYHKVYVKIIVRLYAVKAQRSLAPLS